MQVCGLSRIVIPAMFAGIIVATFTQSELLGWAAAIVVGLAVAAYQRVTGWGARCAVSTVEHTTREGAANDEPVGVTR